MKKFVLWIATIIIATLTYIGALTILGTVMYNDWRIFFLAALPSMAFVAYVGVKLENA